MAARPEGLLESLGKTRAGPWLRRPPQAEGPPHTVQDAGLREHPSAGAPILEEQSRGASGQGSERRRSLGRRAHTRPLAKRCAPGGPQSRGGPELPRPLPGNLAPGPPAASVAMVTPAQGSPPGPQMLGLISLSASGSGGDRLSEQG